MLDFHILTAAGFYKLELYLKPGQRLALLVVLAPGSRLCLHCCSVCRMCSLARS